MSRSRQKGRDFYVPLMGKPGNNWDKDVSVIAEKGWVKAKILQ
jgi:hypothetical protein